VDKDRFLRTILLLAPTTDCSPIAPRDTRAMPVWLWRRLRRGHASLRGADLLYIEAMQACAELIYGKSKLCKPARSWFTVYRGHASLRGADLRYIGAMQACAELIYGKSKPCKPARSWFTVYRGHIYRRKGFRFSVARLHLPPI